MLWHLQFNRRLLYLIQEYNTEKVRKTPHIYEYLVECDVRQDTA